MDPQAALLDLLDAYERNDRDRVDELLATLATWNEKGGFPPKVIRPPNQSIRHFIVASE